MGNKISLYILLGTVALIGLLFYQVIRPFLFSLLFAAVLAVLFRPVYSWLVQLCRGWRHVAAGLTTTLIVLLIILPLGGAMVMAGIQLFNFSGRVIAFVESADDEGLAKELEEFERSPFWRAIAEARSRLSPDQQQRAGDLVSTAADEIVKRVYAKTLGLAGDVVRFVIGFVIMTLALYYFLAGGERVIKEIQHLSPLEESEERELFAQFERVCRGVVMGSVVSALAQAVLAAIGFAVAGVPNVWLLMAVTMFCAFIPFVGAGSVCTAVSLYLAFEGHYVTAGVLFAYSMAIVATVDNVLKAYVIGAEVKLNPLVVLITVLGAIQLVGLWGVFVGPMVAAFFYALLAILRERIRVSDEE